VEDAGAGRVRRCGAPPLDALGIDGDDPDRYIWRPVPNGDANVPPLAHRLLRSVAERQRWRALSGFHFHDLRHTGNKFVSQSGATLRELMNRMGHSTTRAAFLWGRCAHVGTPMILQG
jgi:integrase